MITYCYHFLLVPDESDSAEQSLGELNENPPVEDSDKGKL